MAGRGAGRDFVYGEIKPPAGLGFFARLVSGECSLSPSLSLKFLWTGWIFDWLADSIRSW